MEHLTKLSHINYFMNASSSLFKKILDLFLWIKKIGFWFVCKKIRSVLKQSKKNKKIKNGFWFVCKKKKKIKSIL